jgi:hypothetical protein
LGWSTWRDHHGVCLARNLIQKIMSETMKEEEDPGTMDRLNFIDTIFTLQDDERVDITEEQLEEIRKRVARQARLEVLNQMDEDLKDKLRKKKL